MTLVLVTQGLRDEPIHPMPFDEYDECFLQRLRRQDEEAFDRLVAADWKIERHGMIESARSDYEHVVKSFSQTEWADAARQRLVALQN